MMQGSTFGDIDWYSQDVLIVFLRALPRAIAEIDSMPLEDRCTESLLNRLRYALSEVRQEHPPLSVHDSTKLDFLMEFMAEETESRQ